MGRLFLLFTIVPLVELYLLVKLGSVMGVGTTILLVLATGIGGAHLARSQGSKVISEWQDAMNTGRMPAEGVLGGVMVLVGGVLLVTPGVLTDLVGISLLVPFTRAMWAAGVRRWLEARVAAGDVRVVGIHEMHGSSGSPGGPFGPRPDARASAPKPGSGARGGGPSAPGRSRAERPPPGVIEVEGEEIPPSTPAAPED